MEDEAQKLYESIKGGFASPPLSEIKPIVLEFGNVNMNQDFTSSGSDLPDGSSSCDPYQLNLGLKNLKANQGGNDQIQPQAFHKRPSSSMSEQVLESQTINPLVNEDITAQSACGAYTNLLYQSKQRLPNTQSLLVPSTSQTFMPGSGNQMPAEALKSNLKPESIHQPVSSSASLLSYLMQDDSKQKQPLKSNLKHQRLLQQPNTAAPLPLNSPTMGSHQVLSQANPPLNSARTKYVVPLGQKIVHSEALTLAKLRGDRLNSSFKKRRPSQNSSFFSNKTENQAASQNGQGGFMSARGSVLSARSKSRGRQNAHHDLGVSNISGISYASKGPESNFSSFLFRSKSRGARDNSRYLNTEQSAKPFLIIKLEVDVGKFEELRFFEGDKPERTVKEFCAKYGLPEDQERLLNEQLLMQIDQVKQTRSKQQEKLRGEIRSQLESEAREFLDRSKSRKRTKLGDKSRETSQSKDASQTQAVHNRLYSIALVKQQKNLQNQNIHIKPQSRTEYLNQPSNLKAGNQTNQSSKVQQQQFPTTTNTTTQSFINNNISYAGHSGDRMFLMQTKKMELNSYLNSQSSQKYLGPNTDHAADSFVDQSYISDFLHSKFLGQTMPHPLGKGHTNFSASITSKMMCGDRPSLPVEDLLLDQGKRYHEKLSSLSAKKNEDLKDQCPFQPQLDQKRLSKYLGNTHHNPNLISSPDKEGSNEVTVDKKIHEFLYKEDKERQLKQSQVQNQVLDQIKKEANRVQVADPEALFEQVQQVTQRLTNTSQRKRWLEEKQTEKLQSETCVDPLTGQPLFQPQISRTDRSQINSERNKFVLECKEKISGATIHDSLYLESQKILKSREQHRETRQQEFASTQRININKISDQITQSRQQQKIEELFRALDSDEDGFISSDQIDLSQLNNKALDLLTEFLLSLEQERKILNVEQFTFEIEKIVEKLPIVDKESLLGAKKKLRDEKQLQEKQQQLTHRPQLTEKSIKLAEKRSKSRGGADRKDLGHYLSKALTQSTKNLLSNQKVLQKQDANAESGEVNSMRIAQSEPQIKELAECTFKPNLPQKTERLAQKAKQRERSGKDQQPSGKSPLNSKPSGCLTSRQVESERENKIPSVSIGLSAMGGGGRDLIRKSMNQPIQEKKNQELMLVAKKTINLHI